MTIIKTNFFFNRPHASRRAKTKSNLLAKNNNSFIIFLIGLLVGITITLLIFFLSTNNMNLSPKSPNKKLSNNHEKLVIPQNINKNKNNNTKKITSNNNYEFYNLLPKMGSSTTKNQYFIQAGTFHNITEADELKAKLTLQGFETKIETSSIHNNNWYKVLLGPFSSEETATTKKQQLDLAGIKNTFIRINEKINEN